MIFPPQLPECWDYLYYIYIIYIYYYSIIQFLVVSQPGGVPEGTSIKHTDFFLQEGKEFAESKSLLFMETSVKQNYQVSEVFDTIGE